MTGDLLSVQGLRLGYARSDIVHGISFHVPRGSIVSLIGANGAGNSTTLRGLSGSSLGPDLLSSRVKRLQERHRTR
jgi:branched-chain amino acid transport system ATP-binding protein